MILLIQILTTWTLCPIDIEYCASLPEKLCPFCLGFNNNTTTYMRFVEQISAQKMWCQTKKIFWTPNGNHGSGY